MIPVIIAIVCILVVGGILFLKNRYTYSDTRADQNEYYSVESEDDYPVLSEGVMTGFHAKLIDGRYYLSVEGTAGLLNNRFYYGEKDGKLYYCFPEERLESEVGSSSWKLSGGTSGSEEYVISTVRDNTLYIALDFVKKYTNFSYDVFTEPNRMRVSTGEGTVDTAKITEAGQIRTHGGIKSDIVGDLEEGDDVYVREVLEDWTKVETMDCRIGYIENEKLGKTVSRERIPITDYVEPEFSHLKVDGKINMAWHSISILEGNSSYNELMADTQAVNIVAPTWFTVADEAGNLENKASQGYVTKAHNDGMMVWAVVDNFNTGQTFSEFLRTEETRNKVINTLVGYVQAYKVDGINVDFESIPAEHGADFAQFIRELSIVCRRENIYLSVDNYVPYGYNDYYELDEQAAFCDYVFIMGYDEHYDGSEEAGSVASIEYVKYGIEEALKEVPADQLVNGIPFYTRIWKTENGELSSTAVGLDELKTFMEEHEMTSSWNEEAGQYYSEKEEDGILYQIWIEDVQSVALKLAAVQENNLAGIAEWSLQFANKEIWTPIAEYMNSSASPVSEEEDA